MTEETTAAARFAAAAQDRRSDFNLQQACAALLAIEKKARQNEDSTGAQVVAVAVIRLCAGDYAADDPELDGEGSSAASAASSKAEKTSEEEETKEKDETPRVTIGRAGRPVDWDYLREMLSVLVKRRGQLKAVVQGSIRAGMSIVTAERPPQAHAQPSSARAATEVALEVDATGHTGADAEFFRKLARDSQRLKLLELLRELTEGKIFVEVERARLTHLVADVREVEGKVGEAADVLQSVQVETYGQMEKREKTAFILDQMRLCLAKRDFIKTQILSRKISKRVLDDPQLADLKVRYYLLLTRYYAHDAAWLECARAFLEMYHTLPPAARGDGDAEMLDADDADLPMSVRKARREAAQKAREKMTPKQLLEEQTAKDARKDIKALQWAAIFVALAPHDVEQHDLLVRIAAEKRLESSAACVAHREVLKLLMGDELISWGRPVEGFAAKYWGPDGILRKQLRELPFVDGPHADEASSEAVLNTTMRNRVTDHSVRTVARYYDRISLKRLASLLDVDMAAAEKVVCDLVVKGTIWARINRPEGIVSFREGRSLQPARVLNDWSSNVSELLRLVDTSCHLIARENIVQKA